MKKMNCYHKWLKYFYLFLIVLQVVLWVVVNNMSKGKEQQKIYEIIWACINIFSIVGYIFAFSFFGQFVYLKDNNMILRCLFFKIKEMDINDCYFTISLLKTDYGSFEIIECWICIYSIKEQKPFKKGLSNGFFHERIQLLYNKNSFENIVKYIKRKEDWLNYRNFAIMPVIKDKYPIYYYLDHDYNATEKEIIEHITTIWGKEFYESLPEKSVELDPDNLDYLERLGVFANSNKILCAENEGIRGTIAINRMIVGKYMKSALVDDSGFLPGEVVMITKNNHSLDLYNGETGLVVKFKNDKTLYFMIEKKTKLIKGEGKKDNAIFKLGKFMFYPIRLISREEITFAFAITIHKSQGSDYQSILVILPKKEGHPLVSREIIYTAITRTKGNTYIVSNEKILEEGKNRTIERDTNIE